MKLILTIISSISSVSIVSRITRFFVTLSFVKTRSFCHRLLTESSVFTLLVVFFNELLSFFLIKTNPLYCIERFSHRRCSEICYTLHIVS